MELIFHDKLECPTTQIATEAGTTTVFIGNHFEWKNSAMTKYYYAGGMRIAVRNGNTSGTSQLSYLLSDHLGSTRLTYRADTAAQTSVTYTSWGVASGNFGTTTAYTYTGQYSHTASFGLMYYNARWYDPTLKRFAQADSIVPNPGNPMDFDRYAYVRNNPLRFTDSTGHCIDGVSTWICVALIAGVVLKAVDYGWTAYDAWQSGQVLVDPNASREDKLLASLNLGLAVIFEAGEPDDLLPAGLPLDDVGRRTVMKGARDAFEEGGEAALEKFLRESLGSYADDVIGKMGLGQAMDPNKLTHIFNNPKHHLDDLVNAFGGNQQSTYNAVWREFSNVAGDFTADELTRGIQITVNGITLTVRGAVVDGVAKIGTFFVP